MSLPERLHEVPLVEGNPIRRDLEVVGVVEDLAREKRSVRNARVARHEKGTDRKAHAYERTRRSNDDEKRAHASRFREQYGDERDQKADDTEQRVRLRVEARMSCSFLGGDGAHLLVHLGNEERVLESQCLANLLEGEVRRSLR